MKKINVRFYTASWISYFTLFWTSLCHLPFAVSLLSNLPTGGTAEADLDILASLSIIYTTVVEDLMILSILT